jgi:hypothetical protein
MIRSSGVPAATILPNSATIGPLIAEPAFEGRQSRALTPPRTLRFAQWCGICATQRDGRDSIGGQR